MPTKREEKNQRVTIPDKRLKRKISKIIQNTYFENEEGYICWFDKMQARAISDALIEAGIGDITDMKQWCSLLLTAANYFEDKMKEATHRAAVERRALQNAVRDRNYLAEQVYVGADDVCLSVEYYLRQAEGEVLRGEPYHGCGEKR